MPVKPADRPGVRTSEFWTTLAGLVVVLLNEEVGLDLDVEQTIALVGVVASYVLSRAWTKRP